MKGIKAKLEAFMYGRNGMDRLNRNLVWIYLLIFIASMFLVPEGGGLSVGNYVVDGILALIIIIVLFRAFSRNVVKRRQECDKWSTFWWRFRTGNVDKSFSNQNAFKYITCERCNTTSRVPAGKGKIIVICPKCQTRIPTET